MGFKIFQIEITSDCNYRCTYCPRTKHMTRPIQAMKRETVMRVIEIMQPQLAIRLHHYGESLLEKDLCYFTIRALKASGKVQHIILNTNGSLLTRTILEELFAAGLSYLNVSYHTQQSIVPLLDEDVVPVNMREKIGVLRVTSPDKVESVRRIMQKLDAMGYNVELKRMRNLGQIGCADDSKLPKVDCAFLANNEWIVQSNGDIGTCCHTFDKEGVIGNVWDENVWRLQSKPYKHCVGCPGYTNDGPSDAEVIPLFTDRPAKISSVVHE